MLSQQHRLPHSIRLPHPRTISHPLFSVKVAPNGTTLNRFGVIAGKKIDKRATVRNRMRRLLHHFIYDNLAAFKDGYDYLFIVHTSFSTLTQQDKETMLSLLKKAA